MNRTFLVTIKEANLPSDVTNAEIASYIRIAVRRWCKGYDPYDYIYSIGNDATVKSLDSSLIVRIFFILLMINSFSYLKAFLKE